MSNDDNYVLDFTPRQHSAGKRAMWKFHKENPIVWELFQKYTFKAIEAGLQTSSAWFIVNRIRWETDVDTKGSEFKISNNHIAYYARYFHTMYPEHNGFFKLKPQKEEREAA